MTCAQCRHWEANDHYPPSGGPWGICRLAAGVDGYALNKQSLAFAEDRESYRADLVTHSDFGCVQFVAKEAAE